VYAGVHRAPPELWPRPGGEEVRGPTSAAVTVDGTGTGSVAPVMAPPGASCSQWSVHCKTLNKNHLRRRERERLALMTADV
jgi:hypothetical protein